MCKTEIVDTICGVPVSAFGQKPTPSEIAAIFCTMSDDQQAEFFVAVAKIAEQWGGAWHYQFYLAGKHLGECADAQACDAGVIVKEMYDGLIKAQARLAAA